MSKSKSHVWTVEEMLTDTGEPITNANAHHAVEASWRVLARFTTRTEASLAAIMARLHRNAYVRVCGPDA
jgi:predicted component of type VI protein secretion system